MRAATAVILRRGGDLGGWLSAVYGELDRIRNGLSAAYGAVDGRLGRLEARIALLEDAVADLSVQMAELRRALSSWSDKTLCVAAAVSGGCLPAEEVVRRCGVSISFIRKKLVRARVVKYRRNGSVCPPRRR
jgi:hypothetical protein